MKKLYLLMSFVLLSAGLGSCISNDIPYPVVEINIAGVTGDGLTVSDIDVANHVITLKVDEKIDIRSVKIDKVTYDLKLHSVNLDKDKLLSKIKTSSPVTGTFDLRTPIYTTLSLYQKYDWTIRATQTIERDFTVEGQIGATEFDLKNRTAIAYVSKTADRSAVTVKTLKLEAADITTYSPTLEDLSGSSFETVRFVDVTCHNRTERWLLYVVPTSKNVELTMAEPWTQVIWLGGSGIAGEKMGFKYRLQDTETWKEVENVTVDGGSFTGRLTVDASTTYEVMAYCGDEETAPKSVTTEAVVPLTNGGMEEWCTIKDVIYPYASADKAFWGTGNPGAAVANSTLTQAGEARPGSSGKYGAYLKSTKAGIMGIGKFAAGNLFIGRYDRNAGTNGVLTFGCAFTVRPTALKVWVKYNRGLINMYSKRPAGTTIANGDPDNGIIYIALGNWTADEYGKDNDGGMIGTSASPICVDTRNEATFFKSNGKNVIGYGERVLTESIDTWTQITIPITYANKTIRPTNMFIVCSASRWGDYFTGSTDSKMWLDDFELVYE